VNLDQDLTLARLRDRDIGVDLCGLAFDRDESFHCGGHSDTDRVYLDLVSCESWRFTENLE
jgi:hypothetical protein